MRNLRKIAPKVRTAEPPENVAAQEELTVLEKLARGLSAKISEYWGSRRPPFGAKTTQVEFSVHEVRQSLLIGYQELAHHCYGRTVTGILSDDDERSLGRSTYRITQANVGYVDDGCAVLARNAPLTSKLVTARPGEEPELKVPGGIRYLAVDEVRTFEGPVSLESRTDKPNFRMMTLLRTDHGKPFIVKNLRSFVQALAETPKIRAPEPAEAPPRSELVEPKVARDPTWFEDWGTIDLGVSDTLSLSHQFFTRTTIEQETALNNPRGLTIVEGIGGSGKTSVALGRLKFFANFATGQHTEDYGLKNAPMGDFSPVGMMGFVLNHSLKRYLRDTAIALELAHLPIRDFEEFRSHLSNQFGLSQKFKRKQSAIGSSRTRIAWLRAIDAAMARAASARIRDVILRTQDVASPVKEAMGTISNELASAEPVQPGAPFHLAGLAARIVAAVLDAERRVREAAIRERYAGDTFGLDRENALRRLQEETERQALSPLTRRLAAALTAHDLITPAIQLKELPDLARQAFGSPSGAAFCEKLDNNIIELRNLLANQDDEGRCTLTDADIVTLIALAALIADGFEYPEVQAEALNHLYQIRRNTAIFIDEVQDFTEVQVFLMGMTALSTYHQITLSGDSCQRLHADGIQNHQNLFPFVPRSYRNKPIFLDQNFRQREELAEFSAGFRFVLQGDVRFKFAEDSARSPATVYTFSSREKMAQLVLHRVRYANANTTIAVIAPSLTEAELWYDLLEQDLAAYHRPALLSRREDLTRRFDVHFTDAREVKGLEFNVVIIPDLGAFALGNEIGRNEAYVAISRPRQALLLGCNEQLKADAELQKLVRTKLIEFTEIPARIAH
jgi:hypothetical protein